MIVEPPYEAIAEGLQNGTVVPFLGASASAVYRPQSETWQPGRSFMPFGRELAAALAAHANYPIADTMYKAALTELLQAVLEMPVSLAPEKVEALIRAILHKHMGEPPDLALIASWVEHVQGDRHILERKLHQCFAIDCAPEILHTTLARIEGIPIYVTTNYDDLLEKALVDRRPHVLVDRAKKGIWVRAAGRPLQRVGSTELNALLDNPITQKPSHPIVFKMHGSVDVENAANDSYLIAEQVGSFVTMLLISQ